MYFSFVSLTLTLIGFNLFFSYLPSSKKFSLISNNINSVEFLFFLGLWIGKFFLSLLIILHTDLNFVPVSRAIFFIIYFLDIFILSIIHLYNFLHLKFSDNIFYSLFIRLLNFFFHYHFFITIFSSFYLFLLFLLIFNGIHLIY